MNKELLQALELCSLIEVQFMTKKGKVRVMHCTRNLGAVPVDKRSGILEPVLNGPDIVAVYDWLNGAWRAFRWDSVLKWEEV